MEEPRRLNLGCGIDIKPGHLNADRVRLPGVDLVFDANRHPFPFRDSVFDEIYLSHVLEHLSDTVGTMEEIHRIARPGALVTVHVTRYKHANAVMGPTHVRFCAEQSFYYFGKNDKSYYSKARFDVIRVEKQYDYHIERYVGLPFPRLLPWVERYLDGTVVQLTFHLQARK